MRGKQGFTLIELLVVIAIIAILAAILFPVFSSAKESGRRAACLSNLKQIGTATMSYVDDNNGVYPKVMPSNAEFDAAPPGHFNVSNGLGSGYKQCWMDLLYPYIKSWGVFRCPSAPQRGAGHEYNFGFNCWVMWHPDYGTRLGKFSAIHRPSRMILISQMYGDYMYVSADTMEWSRDIVRWSDTKYTFNHNKGTNVIHGDGHARWLSIKDNTLYDNSYW